MHDAKLSQLHNHLSISCLEIHSKRLERLMLLVGSCLNGGKLTLTSLGRNTRGTAKVKNKIKASDRFLSNANMFTERLSIYSAVSKKIIGNLKKVDILVDWSSCASRDFHVLRASIAFSGRSYTIYEEVHPEKQLGKYNVHKAFLTKLKQCIPLHTDATIVTDAGFHSDWFLLVIAHGWEFVGRVLSNAKYTFNETHWEECTQLYQRATNKPSYIGDIILSKSNRLPCQAYLFRDKKSKKCSSNKSAGKNKSKLSYRKNEQRCEKYRKTSRKPWLLVTSHPGSKSKAKKIIKCYQRRMKIEHDFRDTKDFKSGLGLNLSRTHGKERLAVLLLIAALASFVLMLIGMAAEMKNIHYDYQANSTKHKRVLSLIYLGEQVLKHGANNIKPTDIEMAIKELRNKETTYYDHFEMVK